MLINQCKLKCKLKGKYVPPVLRLLISSDISAAQLLHQDADDADEQDEVDLKEKHEGRRVNKVCSSAPDRCDCCPTCSEING